MSFYTIRPASDTPETGPVYPQVEDLSPDYILKAPDSIHNLKVDRFPEFIPNLNYFVLHKKAKLTDIISQGYTNAYGLLISDKVKEIFDQHNIVSHKYYKAVIKSKATFYEDYYWMHIVCNLATKIDYNQTEFYLINSFKKVEPITITSYEDMKEKRMNISTLKRIKSDSIVFIDDTISKLDLFTISTFDSNIYISEKLKNCLQASNITGMQINQVRYLK